MHAVMLHVNNADIIICAPIISGITIQYRAVFSCVGARLRIDVGQLDKDRKNELEVVCQHATMLFTNY